MNKIIFYSIDERLCCEWSKTFNNIEEVEVQHSSFEDIKATYVVTAGNSYGIMTGGIDLAVRNYYGYGIQDAIQEILFFNLKHKLDVGSNIIISTKDIDKPNLVYAATMEYPKIIDKKVVYKTTYNILKSCYKLDGNIAICGLGAGTGKVPAEDVALENYKAYTRYLRRNK